MWCCCCCVCKEWHGETWTHRMSERKNGNQMRRKRKQHAEENNITNKLWRVISPRHKAVVASAIYYQLYISPSYPSSMFFEWECISLLRTHSLTDLYVRAAPTNVPCIYKWNAEVRKLLDEFHNISLAWTSETDRAHAHTHVYTCLYKCKLQWSGTLVFIFYYHSLCHDTYVFTSLRKSRYLER